VDAKTGRFKKKDEDLEPMLKLLKEKEKSMKAEEKKIVILGLFCKIRGIGVDIVRSRKKDKLLWRRLFISWLAVLPSNLTYFPSAVVLI